MALNFFFISEYLKVNFSWSLGCLFSGLKAGVKAASPGENQGQCLGVGVSAVGRAAGPPCLQGFPSASFCSTALL